MALSTPSKLVSERISLTFNFSDEMEWGEAILSAVVTVKVLSGTDPAPERLFYNIKDITEQTVIIQIQNGVAGTLYTVTVTAVAALHSYDKYVHVAALPDQAELPQVFATFLTSRPYPVYLEDGMSSEALISDGNLTRLIVLYTAPPEGINNTAQITAGQFRDSLVTYSFAEGFDSTSIISAGDIRQILRTYTAPPEGIDSFASISTGTIKVVLITYTSPPEGIDSTATITAGSLT